MPIGLAVRTGRWGRIGDAVALAAAPALAIGIATNDRLEPGRQQRAKASGNATVQRRDLVATDTESGTLSYADPQTSTTG